MTMFGSDIQPQRRPGFVAYFEPWSLNYCPLTTLAPGLGVTETNYVSLSSYTGKKTKEILLLSEKRTLRVERKWCNDLRKRWLSLMGSPPSGHVIEPNITT